MKLIIKDGFFLSFKIIVIVELRTGARCLEVSLGRLRIGEDTLHPLLAIGSAGEAEGNEAALHMPIRIAGDFMKALGFCYCLICYLSKFDGQFMLNPSSSNKIRRLKKTC